jgi:hypothetical protein
MKRGDALELLGKFDEKNLPDLDVVVRGALELFIKEKVPKFKLKKFKRPLVVGSGNAAVTGKILFENKDAVVADEGTYKKKLKDVKEIDGAVLISAFGGKSSVGIAQDLRKRKIPTWLLTNNENALVGNYVKEDRDIVFPKNREPYTYNTSTYMGMILGHTGESPRKILDFIDKKIDPLLKGKSFKKYDSFYILVEPIFDNVRELFMTKFDELFGPKISGRVFTPEQTKHAKTVIDSKKEFFISLGLKNKDFGETGRRLDIPLPKWAKAGTVMAIGYYVIGKIQRQKPDYFGGAIKNYMGKASKNYGQKLSVIVE